MNTVSYRPLVVEDGDTRLLRFNSLHVQSEMSVSAPNELVLGYTRAMMGFLLWQPEPRDIVVVGLGGGSLSKYCRLLLPEARVTTVEISRHVIELRDEFCIPPDSDNFRVVHADAVDYLRDTTNVADVILLDGYDDYGLPEALGTTRFYDHCRRSVRDGGIVVANLHDNDGRHEAYRSRLGRSFAGKVLRANSLTSDNVILFALKHVRPVPWAVLQQRAIALQMRTGLPFKRFLSQMWTSARVPGKENWLEPVQDISALPEGCASDA